MSNSADDHVSPAVRYEVHGDIAVLHLDNPPVNGLGDTVRAGIHAGIARAAADERFRAIVLVGSGKGFCGGADLRQFNTPAASAEPMLGTVLRGIQEARKPVVAAISGFALGGGLELTLACHYRLAATDAELGLPEVTLGLIPGAGGTQRLPRLIGTQRALRMIQDGATVSGRQAHTLGIVDAVFDQDPVDAGCAFAQQILQEGKPLPVVDRLTVADEGVDFEEARRCITPNARNGLAQRLAIDCVEASTHLPIEDGLALERRAFVRLLEGPESKALRHVFFAEKQAAKIVGLPSSTTPRRIDTVAVIGAGTMGTGIAIAFGNAGIPVVLTERSQDLLDRGAATIRRTYEATAAKGRLTASEVEERIARITPTLDIDAIADADLVVEAVFEEMDLKKQVFGALERTCKPGAILASNTSRLDINEIAASTNRPSDVVGLHFFSPANVMRLLEVVRGEATSPDVLATSMQLARRIGKIPVLSQVCDGFIGNRMLTPYRREADFLLEEGADPQQVDRALTDFGMAMGPFTMSDMAGLDIGRAARNRLAVQRPAQPRYSTIADRICEAGRFGVKTGAGYYRYAEGERTPIPDPDVDRIIRQSAMEAGVERRTITDEEIVDRCLLALVNEGAKLLAEGIAHRASDVDVVYVNGYGFPAYRGGPLYWAGSTGLDRALSRIHEFHKIHGEHWAPAPLLEELVDSGAERF